MEKMLNGVKIIKIEDVLVNKKNNCLDSLFTS